MQAFGPYLDKTVIDFTKLYANGLFLITGATGCGKTTILDAMSYALYGRATGSVRDARDMRTTSAPDSLETSVSFEFELGGSFYKFERGIKLREVKRRSGEIDKVTDTFENCYELEQENWRLLCEGAQVKEKAAELLGFSHEQFSQVVVLPQGEFRKLLTAPSLEKQKILETLFKTSRWQAFTKSLQERSKSLDAKLFECAANKSALLKNAGCEDIEALCAKLDSLKDEYGKSEEAVKAVNEAYAQASANYSAAQSLQGKFAEFDAVRKRILELENKAAYVKSLKQKLENAKLAEKVLPYLDALEKAETAAAQAKSAVKNCENANALAQKEAEKAKKELEIYADGDEKLRKISAEALKLENLLEPSKSLAQAQNEFKKRRGLFDTAKQNVQKAETELKAAEKAIDGLKAKIKENFDKNVSRVPELKAYRQTLEAQAQSFLSLKKQQLETKKLGAELGQKREEYKKLNHNLKIQKLALEKMQESFEHDAAVRLAGGLCDGKPCPVCGSVSHPSPAAASGKTAAKEEIDAQKSVTSGLEEKLRKLGEDGGKLGGEFSAAEKRFSELKTECEKSGRTEAETLSELEKTAKTLQIVEKEANLQKMLEEKEKSLTASIETKKSGLEDLKAELERVAAEVSKLEGRTAELSAAVPENMRDVSAVLTKIESLKKCYSEISEKIKAARDGSEAAQNALAAARERLKAAQENESAGEKRLRAAFEDYGREFGNSGLENGADIKSLVMAKETQGKIAEDIENFDREVLLGKENSARLQNEIKNMERPDVAAIKIILGEKQKAAEQTAMRKGSLESDMKNLGKIKAQLAAAREREEKLKERYALYNYISRLCGGENPRKTPIHQFVLGLMLDDIVISANVHLNGMSRGRYCLVRASEPMRGGGSKGLDLSVDDAWSGGERSVSTLSGGEMFLASLSLAFGLSDVVQSYAGGIRLDSLFIDEGFGSLDAETLDTAMGALERLRLSGRLIGVISHVNELRSRIHSRIEVTRRGDGSAKAEAVVS